MTQRLRQLRNYAGKLRRIREIRREPRSRLGCGNCARMASLASAKPVSPRLATKTGASRISTQSRKLLSSWSATAIPCRRNKDTRAVSDAGRRLPARVRGWALCAGAFLDRQTARPESRSAILPAEIARNPGAIEKHLGRYLNVQRDAFGALNTAFLEDGAYVHIAKASFSRSPICHSVRFDRARFARRESSAQSDRGGREQPGHDRRGLRVARRRTGASATRSRNWSPATTAWFRTT